MKQQVSHNYTNAIRQIKSAILKSHYRAAALTNRELLSLYYGIGKYISENSRHHFWGTNAIETISRQLQQELPGLRGFSEGNLRKMRIFFEEWEILNSNRSPVANKIQTELLTVNIQLQSFVVRKLKRGSLRAKNMGKMNFYLSALDYLVRLPL